MEPKLKNTTSEAGLAAIYLMLLFFIIGFQFTYLQQLTSLKARDNNYLIHLIQRHVDSVEEVLHYIKVKAPRNSNIFNTDSYFGKMTQISPHSSEKTTSLIFEQNKLLQLNWRLLGDRITAFQPNYSFLIPTHDEQNLIIDSDKIILAYQTNIINLTKLHSKSDNLILGFLGHATLNKIEFDWELAYQNKRYYTHLVAYGDIIIKDFNLGFLLKSNSGTVAIFSQNGEIKLVGLANLNACNCSDTKRLNCLIISTDMPVINIKTHNVPNNTSCINPIFAQFGQRDELVGSFITR